MAQAASESAVDDSRAAALPVPVVLEDDEEDLPEVFAPAEPEQGEPEQEALETEPEIHGAEAEPEIDGPEHDASAVPDEPAPPDVDEGPKVSPEPQEAHTAGNAMPVSTRHAWRRLGRLVGPRVSPGNLLAALMTVVVGFALVAQVQNADTAGLEELSETDLVALLDDVTERADTLEDEIRLLESDKRALEQGSGAEAAQAAEARLQSLQILAGTVPVEGPGITMTVDTPKGDFTPTMMIDAMQELRNAGAEAIQIGPVRVVSDTWIGLADGELIVEGQLVEDPFRIIAIGDPHTLSGAMAIPGGFSDSVRGIEGQVQIVERDTLVIDALHQSQEPQYARPVPSE